MRKWIITIMSATLAIVTISSCSKDDDDNTNSNAGEATVSFRLTDGPADYDAVYLDIQSVELTMSGSEPVVLTPVRPGLYDVLKFRNGTDTLLMMAEIPTGTVQQMRLKLGPNSTIVVDGQSYPLSTPSGQQSGIKLNLNQEFVAGNAYDVWIDFDAAKSILQTGNGQYKLKPVIRAYSSLTDGRIKGYVEPLHSLTTVYAVSGIDTFAAIPDPINGYFRISGLPQATYDVWFDTDAPTLQDQMIPNVQVVYGTETNLGTITLLP